ncbi:MAG: TRAP transporter small permease [bacterium]|nr:TRAP transporter small permease [bacterium]
MGEISFFSKTEHGITRTIEHIIIVLFICIFLTVFSLVLLRYLFGKSIMGANEMVTTLFIHCSSLGAAIMVKSREHIKISYFLDKLSLPKKKAVMTFNYFIIALLNGVIFWVSLPWVTTSIKFNFKYPITNMPYWVEQIIIPISSLLIIFYCVFTVIWMYRDKEEADRLLTVSDVDLEVEELLTEAQEAEEHVREAEGKRRRKQ